jgi:hypothetical protein
LAVPGEAHQPLGEAQRRRSLAIRADGETRGAFEVVRHQQNHRRVLRPNGPGQRLEPLAVRFVEPFFVADFEMAEPVRGGVAIGGAPASPPRIGRPVHVFNEILHVFGRLVGSHAGYRKKSRRLAQIEEIENAEAMAGIGIEVAAIWPAQVARPDHLLPPIEVAVGQLVDHGAVVAHRGDSHLFQRLDQVLAHGQARKASPRPRLQEGISHRD